MKTGVLSMPELSSGIEMSFADFCKAPVTIRGIESEVGVPESVVDDTMNDFILSSNIETPKVEDILSSFKSGIGLDISKNHTGVAIWKDGKLETLGFAVDMEYDKSSYLAEARMRHEFKQKLYEILKGETWEVCIIEDVYGGTNFDTTRKLLALNCVIDELVLEDKVHIEYLYRFKEAEWLKDLRKIANIGNRLNPKYECQKILEYLKFDFLMEHIDDKKSVKAEIFFEDRCDAAGQLLGLAMRLNSNDRAVKSSSVRLRDLKMYFLEDEDDTFMIDDDIIRNNCIVCEDFPDGSDIEGCLISMAEKHKKEVVSILVDTTKLGIFGVKNGFNFYEQGYGYLVFYNKRTLKKR